MSAIRQHGYCALCEREFKMHTKADLCRQRYQVRGWLCYRCFHVLDLMSGKIKLFEKAISYLKGER